MPIKLVINGYGRIGRSILRALYESGRDDLQVVAINDLGDINVNSHLTQFDTAHGRFPGEVAVDGDCILINGDRIRVFSEPDPSKLPWAELGVDVVHECTGVFTHREQAELHLQSGAGKVLISAPGGQNMDATIVYGVNHHTLKSTDRIISNASCTTNCLAATLEPLCRELGVKNGMMTSVHAFTNEQVLTDAHNENLRYARSATSSIVPHGTGATAVIGQVMPELAGRLSGFTMRVPTINVSIIDLTIQVARDTSVDEVNAIMQLAADGSILSYNSMLLVSVDFNHNANSACFDSTLTQVNQRLVKVCSWYDNEWGFSNRMLDTTAAMMDAQ
ncbi:MAG: type I glyceraldehyde-3-phosphate dehydrogenase [Gammaproteobacteria bacterium]|nr:type I glyceraldehyde-3-phosphate dehydrogenase [Gammaproteobacteria bacterium]